MADSREGHRRPSYAPRKKETERNEGGVPTTIPTRRNKTDQPTETEEGASSQCTRYIIKTEEKIIRGEKKGGGRRRKERRETEIACWLGCETGDGSGCLKEKQEEEEGRDERYYGDMDVVGRGQGNQR